MEIPDAVLEARVAEAEEKASFSFMKKNDHHFDEHFTFDAVKVARPLSNNPKPGLVADPNCLSRGPWDSPTPRRSMQTRSTRVRLGPVLPYPLTSR